MTPGGVFVGLPRHFRRPALTFGLPAATFGLLAVPFRRLAFLLGEANLFQFGGALFFRKARLLGGFLFAYLGQQALHVVRADAQALGHVGDGGARGQAAALDLFLLPQGNDGTRFVFGEAL